MTENGMLLFQIKIHTDRVFPACQCVFPLTSCGLIFCIYFINTIFLKSVIVSSAISVYAYVPACS